jgi:predicted ATPase with chaperone activity
MKLPTNVITPIMDYLRQEKLIEMRGPDPLKPTSNALGLSNRYGLTEGGKKRAAQLLEYDAYVGPAPVSLEDYWEQVERQKIGQGRVTRARLEAAFEGLVLPSDLVAKLGPALVSGKPLFLYGPPGNGKTTLAVRMGKIWDDVILTPYALYVEGNVIRVFDEISHRPLPMNDNGSGNSGHNLRWVHCYRPIVIVGGELSLDMLDLAYNPTLKYYNAPLQLKANSGLFIVDDLGRQQMKPQDLLNRWIIPLENKQDFLILHTGQKFVIPFDQFLIFATNLEPHTLMDEAFLRRIRSKVKVNHVEREQFLEIFRLVCDSHQLEFNEPMVRYLVSQYYGEGQRAMNACHPRDLVEQILDYCSFNDRAPMLSKENLDHACQVYFVD